MYKRRAHVVFLHEQRPEIAACAVALAEQSGGEWLEARHEYLDQNWPDLLILLDGREPDKLDIPQHTRGKAWPLGTDWEAELQQRIGGMIGGFRLLARLDDSKAPLS
ncbi:hypothetical protein AB4090_13570 [Acidithiobacillus sp. IBUN Pt1247-S3]|uniref:hypothetical protein n=1 Tax=Acidithiobacillus sp. IBUN Pt1247-S3 TaxID=3166642 RepID=UPI0034E4CDCC